MLAMKKYVIITSIFPPTMAVKKFSQNTDWQLVVVADKKTPINWKLDNTQFISVAKQQKSNDPFIKAIPWNNYGRKMIGYLEAINGGADIIADTDDDNIPYDNWGRNINFTGSFHTASNLPYYNVYRYFSDKEIWPRGFPLRQIKSRKRPDLSIKNRKVGIWQFLANGDPDVDAIYRLTCNQPVYFTKKPSVVLEQNTICPFNSQNTFTIKQFFPLLYMPAYVTIRFTDILRGLVAQPILWAAGYRLGFQTASVLQKRNTHDYLRDFLHEIPMYEHTEKVVEIGKSNAKKEKSVTQNLYAIYNELIKQKIVPQKELPLLLKWLKHFS
jgi:hypothetical protein